MPLVAFGFNGPVYPVNTTTAVVPSTKARVSLR